MKTQRLFVAHKAIIANDQGQVLLLCESNDPGRTQSGRWGFPGGRMEFGETPLEALKREVLEEVGLEIESGMPIHVDEWRPQRHPDEDWQIIGIFYLVLGFTGTIVINEEFFEYRWVDETALQQLMFMPEDKTALERAIAYLKRA